MPTEDRVRRHDGRDPRQQPAAQAMAQFSKTASLAVIETQSPSLELRLQHPILFAQEREDVLLLSLQPTTHSMASRN
jgi:hypothetical protein